MKRLTAMLAAAILPFCSIGALYTNSFVRNGATYVQRGALTIKDFVITNITSSGTSITTNDVLLLILSSTNSLVAALTDEDNPLIVQESRTSASSSVSTYSSSSETAYGLGTEEGTPARRSTQDIFGKLDSATTTNDVCNIVTNTITGFTDWVFSPQTNADEEVVSFLFGYDGYNQWSLTGMNSRDEAVFSLLAAGGPDATSLTFGSFYTATRTFMPPRNALGVAMRDDLPPLTNDIPATYQTRLPYPTNAIPYSVISGAPSSGGITTNDVCAIVTNATASFTKWTITRNDQDVTAQVSQPFYGDTPYGDAWTVLPYGEDTIPDPFLPDPPRDATTLNWTGLDEQNETTTYTATRTPVVRNNLGIAGQSGAVNEVLLIGTDGKMYHLRIGSGGSIEVYMEAN